MRDWEEGDDPVKKWVEWEAGLGSEVFSESSEESRYFRKEAVDSSRKRKNNKQWNLKHKVPSKIGSKVW